MPKDVIKVKVMANGIIRTETDPVSAANHSSAESFLSTLAALTGSEVGVVHKNSDHKHHHQHTHVHQHD